MRTLVQGLGVFSIVLGVAELLAPRQVARATGMRGREELLRAYGLREVATGIGLLSARNPAPWLWGRVAGDALDAATLASRLARSGLGHRGALFALGAVVGVAALDAASAQRMSARRQRRRTPARDYSDRVGMPRSPEEMRGAARDAMAPRDMRTPEPMRPYAGA